MSSWSDVGMGFEIRPSRLTTSRHHLGILLLARAADLVAALTWPIDVMEELREAELSGNKQTIQAIAKIDFAGLITAQRTYKKTILKAGAIKTLVRMLVPRLEKGLR